MIQVIDKHIMLKKQCNVKDLNIETYDSYSSGFAMIDNSFMCSFDSKDSSACTLKMTCKIIRMETEKTHKETLKLVLIQVK